MSFVKTDAVWPNPCSASRASDALLEILHPYHRNKRHELLVAGQKGALRRSRRKAAAFSRARLNRSRGQGRRRFRPTKSRLTLMRPSSLTNTFCASCSIWEAKSFLLPSFSIGAHEPVECVVDNKDFFLGGAQHIVVKAGADRDSVRGAWRSAVSSITTGGFPGPAAITFFSDPHGGLNYCGSAGDDKNVSSGG